MAEVRPGLDTLRDEASRWGPAFLRPVYSVVEPKLTGSERDGPPREDGAEGRRRGRSKKVAAPSTDWVKLNTSLPMSYWKDSLTEFHRRKAAAARSGPARQRSPGVPGQNNWTALGPAVLARGPAFGRPPVSGRASRLAISPTNGRVYVASADGGVWRSDDAGRSWRSTMDSFDLDPLTFGTTSLCCGAIAVHPSDPDRVYVGTGEGDTYWLTPQSQLGYMPCYRGIGPLRSDDGGATWVTEIVQAPNLDGHSFFALAVDPANGENVVAATTNGLYQRTPAGLSYQWVQRLPGYFTTVEVTYASGSTTFLARNLYSDVVRSMNGTTWSAVGTGLPTPLIQAANLAVQRNNPNVVYLLAEDWRLWRLDGLANWYEVTGGPPYTGQGQYNRAIAVDALNPNVIYAGGAWAGQGAAIHRSEVAWNGTAYTATTTLIGEAVHSDVHHLRIDPTNPEVLWAATDGGVFRSRGVIASGTFEPRNTGLATLCTEYFSQHPTEPAVILAGLQDNGVARYVGEECWNHVLKGDGGYTVINWADPSRVLVFQNGAVVQASDGGIAYGSWSYTSAGGWSIMAPPLITTPYNPSSPGDAETVAFGGGSYTSSTIQLTDDFGSTWTGIFTTSTGDRVYSLAFASKDRLFAGTTNGHIYRLDRSSGGWTAAQLDNASGGPLPLVAIITGIDVDWADPNHVSIYVTLGGSGDYRHVWHFDGTAWTARSGPFGTGQPNLLDVHHNTVAVDPQSPSDVYAAADIGVWHSADAGMTWHPFSDALPDAAVLDLRFHPTFRLLRACTHGRGLFEYKLDAPPQADTQLYVRDTYLDTARVASVEGQDDPSTWPIHPTHIWLSPNIKVDVPTQAGYQTPTNQIDFYQFNEVIGDGSQQVATIGGNSVVHNRAYVEVHNRGIVPANQVAVTLLLADASTALPPLPAGYEAQIAAGQPVSGSGWVTVGITTLNDVRQEFPRVAAFDLNSTLLPPPSSLPAQSHYCVLALVHAAVDPFTSTSTDIATVTATDRKVAWKNLHIVEFVGTPPQSFVWSKLNLNGVPRARQADLVIEARDFPGRVGLVVPAALAGGADLGDFKVHSNRTVRRWVDVSLPAIERATWERGHPLESFQRLRTAMELVRDEPFLVARGRDGVSTLRRLPLGPRQQHAVFLAFEAPKGAKPGNSWDVTVLQRNAAGGNVAGGSLYRLVVPRKQRRTDEEER